MGARGPMAPSLRQFEHPEEIYKDRLLAADIPRFGDYAEIKRSHCTSWESGLLLKIVDYPHWCLLLCADCGQWQFEWQVRVEPANPLDPIAVKWEQQAPGGPWLYPIRWLRRWESHQV